MQELTRFMVRFEKEIIAGKFKGRPRQSHELRPNEFPGGAVRSHVGIRSCMSAYCGTDRPMGIPPITMAGHIPAPKEKGPATKWRARRERE